MNDTPLLNAIAGLVVFLELSGPDTVDPDAAVAALEQLAAELQRLDPGDQRRVSCYFRGLAATARSPQERALLEDLGESLGLQSA